MYLKDEALARIFSHVDDTVFFNVIHSNVGK